MVGKSMVLLFIVRARMALGSSIAAAAACSVRLGELMVLLLMVSARGRWEAA